MALHLRARKDLTPINTRRNPYGNPLLQICAHDELARHSQQASVALQLNQQHRLPPPEYRKVHNGLGTASLPVGAAVAGN